MNVELGFLLALGLFGSDVRALVAVGWEALDPVHVGGTTLQETVLFGIAPVELYMCVARI